MTHAEACRSDNVFQKACEISKLPITKRQHAKYLNSKGLAFKAKEEAIKALIPKEAPIA